MAQWVEKSEVQAMIDAAVKPLQAQLLAKQPVCAEYLDAAKPAAGDVPHGTIIFVSDAANKFQGSDGSAWLNLS